MTARQLSIVEAESSMRPMNHADHSEARRPEVPGRLAGLLLFAALLAALAAAGWGVISSLGNQDEVPARIGEPVAAAGGSLTVDRVAPENMAPMKMGGFAKQGMSMSMPRNMDMTPEGKRRFTVEVTLAAEAAGSLAYAMDAFRVAGTGISEVSPYQSETRNGGATLLGDGTVPAGSAVSGAVIFQVPEKAKNLTLSYEGGQPVSLDLKPDEGGHGDGDDH